ncbi:MAG TPA: hypothetical protein ENN13_04525 [Candidatus Altiarchaeales archaeon]|nr:hypothetical protein [Candidatus Altiarchaeales archaeon]
MKAVVLLSTGIDSPASAYIMKQQGVELVFAHMHTGESSIPIVGKIRDIIDPNAKIFAVPMKEIHELLRRCEPRYHCVLCKRMMYRLAEIIAKKEEADFIVTGESIGQVASQTLENLLVLHDAVEMRVERPLIAFDKEDAIKVSKKAGLYEASIEDKSGCQYLPKKPSTKARLDKIRGEEEKIDYKPLIEKAVRDSKII